MNTFYKDLKNYDAKLISIYFKDLLTLRTPIAYVLQNVYPKELGHLSIDTICKECLAEPDDYVTAYNYTLNPVRFSCHSNSNNVVFTVIVKYPDSITSPNGLDYFNLNIYLFTDLPEKEFHLAEKINAESFMDHYFENEVNDIVVPAACNFYINIADESNKESYLKIANLEWFEIGPDAESFNEIDFLAQSKFPPFRACSALLTPRFPAKNSKFLKFLYYLFTDQAKELKEVSYDIFDDYGEELITLVAIPETFKSLLNHTDEDLKILDLRNESILGVNQSKVNIYSRYVRNILDEGFMFLLDNDWYTEERKRIIEDVFGNN